MKIAVVGAGFGGLAASYYLSKAGHKVTVIESEDKPGGLAIGFKMPDWKWTIESHYHHWFTNDDSVLNLAREIGFDIKRVTPKTSTYIDGKIYQLDSPLSLLLFEKMGMVDRVRTGLVLFYLKVTNSWKKLEKITAETFVKKYMGDSSWKVLWGPLFEGKFGKYSNAVTASWFWARIKKRTRSLCYPVGGFQHFAQRLGDVCRKNGVEFKYKTLVKNIKNKNDHIYIKTDKTEMEFDKVIVTLPSFILKNIVPDLPQNYIEGFSGVKSLGAVNLLLSLKKPLLADGTYWLNVNEKSFPFLSVVEHTNFMDSKNYGNKHLVYIGNYLPEEHKYFGLSAESLLEAFTPFIKKINPDFKKSWVFEKYAFKAKFAQPIFPKNYSKNLPEFTTPIPNLYLCNMSQVYPWDRGTNYAVENGKKVAEIIING